ncbi:diguanylate cyclase [Marinobacter sp. C2H3]|uniref:diguanylate cyclase n=1 Tax=Marinobacter sp. C2H3 TaxID=3119003 RepID=UPI00300F1B93
MATDSSWKDKYLQELDDAERRQQQWQAERNTLERMLVRTSLASEGQSPTLDSLLERLRDDLRKRRWNVDSWRELQDQIDREITRLDQAPAATRLAPEASPVDSPAARAPSPDLNLDDRNDRLRIARRVGQLLGQMLAQVTLEPEAEARARSLQASLLSSDNWEELREGLNHVADLVIAAITLSKREFEAFLRRLDERLDTLRAHCRAQADAHSDRQTATDALDKGLRLELEGVGQSLRDADDLDSLKSSVSGHLNAIVAALDRFRAEDATREKHLSEQLAAMQEKVAAMEANSEQMREQVRRERMRAMTDLLTQLPNREAWQERLAFEYNRWQRYGHPLSVGVLDIDHFKRVNDSFGHKAGDRVLQLVARELRERLRSTDFIARYGGEEFVLLFPETPVAEAGQVLDAVREHILGLPFHFGGQPVQITVSAGVAGLVDGDAEDAAFDRADRALYQAKDDGRNRVVIERGA